MLLLASLVSLASPASPQESLNERRRTPVVDVIERVKPAVVSISTEVRTAAWDGWALREVQGQGPVGTGVVIFEDGYIITNKHVVQGARSITVTFDESDDPKTYPAIPISLPADEDLALIKIESDEPFHTVKLCESDPILGEPVIAIGNAFGHSHTVSTGIVSGLHREIQTREGMSFSNLIQTDASINPGNSGGPLLNINGELIGINSAMQGMAENIGFAIPVAHVRRVLSEELLALSQAQSWLGFEVDEESLVIESVVPDSPAEKAGLQRGDLLKSLANHVLASVEIDRRDVYRRVRLSIQPGKDVPLTVQRGDAEKKFSLPAWNKVDGILFERLGLGLEVVYFGRRGGTPYLQVTDVYEKSPAGAAGLQKGDLLTSVQRGGREPQWFQRKEDLGWYVSRLKPGAELTIEVQRDLDEDGLYFERDEAKNYSERFRGPITLR